MNVRPTFEPYRVILDYEALEDGFLDRIEDLNTTFDQIDAAAGFTRGNTQKLLSKSRERWARTLGIESMGKMLKGTGMALVLVVDDERFASVKAELIARKRPKPTNVSIQRPTWLFSKKNAANMRALGIKSLSPQQRKRIAKKAAKARWRKAKLNGALRAACATSLPAALVEPGLFLSQQHGTSSVSPASKHQP